VSRHRRFVSQWPVHIEAPVSGQASKLLFVTSPRPDPIASQRPDPIASQRPDPIAGPRPDPIAADKIRCESPGGLFDQGAPGERSKRTPGCRSEARPHCRLELIGAAEDKISTLPRRLSVLRTGRIHTGRRGPGRSTDNCRVLRI
jgi:hypothetical protein